MTPAGLARRFALVAAGLAATSLLAIVLASSWLIDTQQDAALNELTSRERQFHAAAVGSDLEALASRFAEVASSTILATGLVDSAGRETYLVPFLTGIRQINGVPVHVRFTDFEGNEIASNGIAAFSDDELEWMRRELEAGRRSATIFSSNGNDWLVALQPLTYARTKSPEGALLYKVSLHDLHIGERMRLRWGPLRAADAAPAAPVPVPASFEPLAFRIESLPGAAGGASTIAPPYVTIVLIALTLFVAVVVAGALLARILTRDLRRLEAFSRRLVTSGLDTERAPVAGSAEVASLAISINQMLDRLREQHVALVRDREKLAELAGALQAADRRKDDFLAILAHELRNPLAPIRNSVAVLKLHGPPEPTVAWARDVIDRQVTHMARLLDDLLDVSRITRNKLELRREPVEVTQFVNAAIETSRPLIEARSHALAVNLPAAPVWVNGDVVRLAQSLSNLLNNAAKYTPPGGSIAIAARCDADELVVSVRDSGIGIPADAMRGLFRMFSQLKVAGRSGDEGMGIGLSLVKALVELHGGTIEAHSDGPGCGSEFTVRLPVIAAPASARTADTPPASSGASGPALDVIVADDNRDAAESLAMTLRLLGHVVRVAADGVDALALAAAEAPDAMILDVGMPRLDGYATARRVRAEPWGAGVLLVAATGWGQDEDKRRAAEAGFDEHLTKPIEIAALERILLHCSTAERT